MFGYVKANKGELKVWEYETYKAIYCTLCKQLGKSYGIFTRFTLNYDFVFLALLKMSLNENACEIYKKHCTFNPFKKCNYCKNTDGDFDFCAAVAVIMLYYKVLDGAQDAVGMKKAGYKLVKPFFNKKRLKAAKKYPEVEKCVAEYITAQNALEKAECNNLDAICEPTSAALGNIFAMCAENETDMRTLRHLGYCLGKWIYIMDAAADLEDDIKTGAFNPLKKDLPPNTDISEYAEKRTLPVLNTCIYNAGLAFELTNVKKYKGILENIIYSGLKITQKTVFQKENNK